MAEPQMHGTKTKTRTKAVVATIVIAAGLIAAAYAGVALRTKKITKTPDVIVSGMFQGCAPDGSAGVNVTVKNVGNAVTGSFNVSTWGRMDDGTINLGVIGGSWNVASLAVGGTATQQFSTTSAVATSGQLVAIGSNADPENTVSETKENNNTLEIPFSTCTPGPIVINVTSPEWGNAVKSGSSVTLHAIANASDASRLPLNSIVFEIRDTSNNIVATITAPTVDNNPITQLATGHAVWNNAGFTGTFTIYAIGSATSWGSVRSNPVVVRVVP